MLESFRGRMNFLNTGIGAALSAKLAQAHEVRIASAFFSPSEPMLLALKGLHHLELVISEEFTVNDPYQLARLTKAFVRSIPTDDEKGKLHAKVFIATLNDGSHWVLLGSANLTQQGLFANQEACVELQSTCLEDRASINSIRGWFDEIFDKSQPTDLVAAKAIFDQRSRYRLEPRPTRPSAIPIEYWAIKTTSGGAGAEEHWPRLLSEGVVAIGWEELEVDPSKVDEAQLRISLAKFLGRLCTSSATPA